MDAAELAEWVAYARIEPFGEDRHDLQAGVVASVVANCHRGKNSRVFRPSDFLLFRQVDKLPTPEQLQQKIRGVFSGVERVWARR